MLWARDLSPQYPRAGLKPSTFRRRGSTPVFHGSPHVSATIPSTPSSIHATTRYARLLYICHLLVKGLLRCALSFLETQAAMCLSARLRLIFGQTYPYPLRRPFQDREGCKNATANQGSFFCRSVYRPRKQKQQQQQQRKHTSPLSMKSMAVPMACVPVAQADTTPKLGPRHLCSMATTPEAVLEIRAGIRKGDTYASVASDASTT